MKLGARIKAAVASARAAIAKRMPSALTDVIALAGCCAVVHGTQMIYAPLGWVISGIALLVIAWSRTGGTE